MFIFITLQILFDIGAGILLLVLYTVVKELVKELQDLGQHVYSKIPKT